MAKKCKDYLTTWVEWQKLSHEDEDAPSAVRQAIEHIGSCPRCLDDLPSISVDMEREPDTQRRRRLIAAFFEKQMRDGTKQASKTYPAIAAYLARNEDIFKRAFSLRKAIMHDFMKEKLPGDVEYTIRSQTKNMNWVSLFAKNFRTDEKGTLLDQPKMTLEFHINKQEERVLFNIHPGLGLTLSSDYTGMKVENPPVATTGTTRTSTPMRRTATIYSGKQNAKVTVDPKVGKVRVFLLTPSQYRTKVPILVLFFEDGRTIRKIANSREHGYEATFTDIEGGNYMLAIDIMERTEVQGQVQITGEPRTEGLDKKRLGPNRESENSSSSGQGEEGGLKM